MYTGSNQTYNPSFEYGNTKGDLSYFVDGSFLHNNIGIENPTSSANPIHDNTDQDERLRLCIQTAESRHQTKLHVWQL